MKKILIDSYFHSTPSHRLARNITTAGYVVNSGRYSPYDVYHPNGISMLFSDLQKEYAVGYSNEPFSEMSLAGADLLFVPNPDYPAYEGSSSHRLDRDDVDAMMNFMNRGGRILLLVNSFLSRSDFWEENFDYERVAPLFRRLGVRWDSDYMSDDERMLPARYKDLTVGYGQGGRVDGGIPGDAEVLLECEGEILGFRKKVGLGEIAVIGDAGSVSNGLYGFPTFDNRAFILDLIADLLKDGGEVPERFEVQRYGMLSAAPNEAGLSEQAFRSLKADADFQIDHHYRHLVWEAPAERIDVGAADLPFSLETIRSAENFDLTVPRIAYQDGRKAGALTLPVHVTKTVTGRDEEYLITGSVFEEGLDWDDVGADNEEFGRYGVVDRVNTVVQYMLGFHDGALKWATAKHGQILYGLNPDGAHYGGYTVILLGSDCCAWSPVIE